MSNDEDVEILALMREALEKSRGYASYWEWKLDKHQPELHAARVLSRFLFIDQEYSISSVAHDPPDVLVQLDGFSCGVEVTEIVDQNAVAREAKRKQLGLPIEYDWSDWNSDRLSAAFKQALEVKDKKLTGITKNYDELLLAFVTDETMIYPQLVASATKSTRVETRHRAFVILSYDPAADPLLFPDRCPIFEIPLSA